MKTFRLEILGSRGGCPLADNPCPSYLVTAGTTCIVLDCGPGTAGSLWPLLRKGSVTAIVVSHMHGDHFMDLVALTYGFLGEDSNLNLWSRRTPVWLPPGGRDVIAQVADAFGFDHVQLARTTPDVSSIPLVERYFDLREYSSLTPFGLGDVYMVPRRVPHTIEAFALRVEYAGRALAYSGDTTGGLELIDLARGCDLLLCESSAVHRTAALPPGHLSAREAGDIAAAAQARQLVLTHVIQYDATEEALIGEAARAFNGQIDVAAPGRSFAIDQLESIL